MAKDAEQIELSQLRLLLSVRTADKLVHRRVVITKVTATHSDLMSALAKNMIITPKKLYND